MGLGGGTVQITMEQRKLTSTATRRSKRLMEQQRRKAEQAWTCPDDDMVHQWYYKGQLYLRNFDNEVWKYAVKNGEPILGAWCGIYDAANYTIQAAPEPEFID